MTDYKMVPKGIVDELAQFIRQVDGNHKLGAGALAEKICERFRVAVPAVQGEPAEKQPLLCQECGGDGAGGDHEEDCSMAQPAEPHPATDVAGLVEALENLLHYLETDDMRDLDMNKARAALAAHRKQGGAS